MRSKNPLSLTGLITIGLLLTGISAAAFVSQGCNKAGIAQAQPVTTTPAPSTWEYKVLVTQAPSHEKTGPNAMASNEVMLDEAALNALGKDRWELVSSHVEMETSFPNLGDAKYVTGIHSNVRPMRVVMVFKRSTP
jgi:hypothetical protein